MRRLLAAALAATAAAGALAGCGSGKNWAQDCTTTNGVVECDTAHRPQVGDVSGELLDGGAYNVADDRGKVVVVNFWGSWCAPCRAEAADLEKTYQATKARNVTFLGINSRDDRDSAKAFEKGRVTYPSIYDYEGSVALKFDVTQTSTPATLILDRQGRIAAAIRRSTTAGELQPLVERVAAEGNG
ncbi:alkyl hydroperoxide reductase [Actinoplanes sp. SE50]|uniref:TlpA family protein disulfide reductase n=1 Tax=unclassified Actinoplanes TaxID=2626549 RepID=UPI00023EC012|nr:MULTISPECIES: TlpA disulfide reductase family protein [unclassified Actinoplanes]AEV81303.1 alkyl hydroperoxide reductase/thiol specific antioxidant/Mal allergen [Actinoplanes sp. SE50/110]ATO79706.1 alkyl hydroperoxide reductase [Actinoplanes sp. SE50]SLL97109.1 alkyl hydroperoxide reductase [Actinoplanes sp. SE50/110]